MLADKIRLRVKQRRLFDKVVMVTISQKPDLKRIQGEIIGGIGLILQVESRRSTVFKIVHPSYAPTNRELKMPFFLTLRSVQTLLDPKVIDKIKMKLFEEITIRKKIILEGGLLVVDDDSSSGAIGSASGAAVGDNDAPLTVFKTNHYEYDQIGYADFAPPSK
ncbi:hypothetical protein BC332_25625 [Capsicum chinense]|nr:hypothetical protein BC332_25625 [Capsicum chinense]